MRDCQVFFCYKVKAKNISNCSIRRTTTTILTTTHDTQQLLLLLPLPGGQSDVAAAAAPKFNVVHWPLFANQHTHTHTRTNEHTHSRRTADKAEVTSDAELFLLQRTAHINRMHLCVCVCVCVSLSVSVHVCVYALLGQRLRHQFCLEFRRQQQNFADCRWRGTASIFNS